MNKGARDPSHCLRGFPSGSVERIALKNCYIQDDWAATLDVKRFACQIKQHLSKTNITQLGEGTFAKVIKMKRPERRAKAKDGDRRGVG